MGSKFPNRLRITFRDQILEVEGSYTPPIPGSLEEPPESASYTIERVLILKGKMNRREDITDIFETLYQVSDKFNDVWVELEDACLTEIDVYNDRKYK